jgi:hypothetical protein
MPSLRLLHLTFAGYGKPTAQIIFGPRLTVVYGASDTGKSFVAEAIDYMLGARRLNVIPEAEGYTQILLGIALPDGTVVTLMRPLDSPRINIYRADLRDLVHRAPDSTVSAQVSGKSSNNISSYLLERLGLGTVLISTNDNGGTKALNFRDLVHLCLVTETQMVSKTSPVLRTPAASGQTAHKSVLKLLLTGAGEQPVTLGPNPGQRRVHKGKILLLDQLSLDLQRKLQVDANQGALEEQLRRILAQLDAQASSLREVSARQAQVVARRAALSVTLGQHVQRLAELDNLLGRFGLLASQYESDLERLTMVNEAGNLLGYFRTGTCVFCGADPEHQRVGGHGAQETTALHSAVAEESTKTRHLLADLLSTVEDLRVQRQEALAEQAASSEQAATCDVQIARIEEQELRPLESQAAELMNARSRVEQELGLHARLQEFEDVRAGLVADGSAPSGRPSGSIPARTVVAFERAVQRTLDAWHVRRTGEVSYDQYVAELAIGERPRAAHGKGMRAVLHAAFTVALADLCLSQEQNHPGFVVLDSPLVTFREPGLPENGPGEGVAEYFYRHLFTAFAGQAIVVENGDPPADVVDHAQVYMFSREAHGQRFGFFPVNAASR